MICLSPDGIDVGTREGGSADTLGHSASQLLSVCLSICLSATGLHVCSGLCLAFFPAEVSTHFQPYPVLAQTPSQPEGHPFHPGPPGLVLKPLPTILPMLETQEPMEPRGNTPYCSDPECFTKRTVYLLDPQVSPVTLSPQPLPVTTS